MSNRFHVATRKGLFTLERGEQRRQGVAGDSEWAIARTSFLGDNCTLVMHDPRDGSLLAALDHGHFGVKMHRSRDEGATWQEVAAPKYPDKPAGYVPKTPAEGRPVDWALKLVWALAPGGANEPGVLWCGTLPGGLFRSEDGGDSWAINRPLWDDPRREEWFGGGADQPGIHSICVDPRDAAHVTIGVSCGGVWTTRDSGKRWTLAGKGMRAEYMPPERQFDQNVQDPHQLAQCPANPDAMWVQHHNGIFRSTDGGETFSEISGVKPSAFGFPVAVHPKNPDVAWFVPAIKDEKRIPLEGRVVVNRTRDAGKTFDTLTRGLPQEHAYDLVFRHALDVDDTGDRLAFGSTTGSLWVSEDGGDSWQTLSSNLPPVYAVRFEK
ncbi:MAG: exo-alpha-sialidase [Acidimicrobiia bacterium]|nr:exo-alpha-sialidase [Acidimicrobiia bacterium]